jgi:predicted ATPase
VAIKRIVERGEDPAEVERFLQEARLIAQVSSPHVVRYIADGVDSQGCPCLVLEWLQGESLADRLRRHAVSVAQACEIARQVAVGLDALHRAGIVHRDIKPSNLFLREDERGTLHCTILDLGAARARGDAALTIAGTLVGTPAYMSPEQARGERTLTAQSDLFSLGSVLFEMLTRRRAFEGPPHAVLAQILLGEMPDISLISRNAPPSLIHVVHVAMARIAQERYPSASVMARALEEALALGLSEELPLASELEEHQANALSSSAQSDVSTGLIAPLSTPSRPLGAAERRVVCALFATFEQTQDPAGNLQRFGIEAAARNAEVFTLAGARCVAVFGVRWSSGDAVLSAAKTGLFLRKLLAEGAFALVTCRALANSNSLPVDAIERAVELLASSLDALVIDDVSATLLSAHFSVQEEAGRKVVRGQSLSRREAPPKLLGYNTATVGRDREIALLDAAIEESIEGPAAKVVLVTAPAGRGKSRLRWEWLERLRARNESTSSSESAVEVVTALTDPSSSGVALGLLGQLIRSAAHFSESDSASTRREKLLARVGQSVAPADTPRVAAFLGELCATPFSAEQQPQLSAARNDRMLMADQIRRAWDDWLRAETRKHALVLVIEDIHWSDAASVMMLDAALGALSECAFTVVAFARPEVHETFSSLFSQRSLLEIRLSELRKKDAESLIRSVLGDVDDDTVKRLTERASGNPFVLEELIRAAFVGDTATLPQSVLAVADARLQALPPESRRVLRLASVLGSEFWPGAMQMLLGESEQRGLAECLVSLERSEMITRRSESRFAAESQYGFRHALLRDAAYAMLTEEDRVSAHYVAGEWLARAGEPDSLRIAEHFERGGRPDRAAGYYAHAAEAAMQRSDLQSVLSNAERSLACGVDDASAGELWLLRAEAHRWRGENPEALSAATEALERLPPGCDAWFRAVMEQLQSAGRLADKPRLASTARTLLAIKSRRISGAEAMACAKGIVQLSHHGYAEMADELLNRLVDADANGEANWDPRVRGTIMIAQGMMSHSRGELGSFATTMSHAASCLEQAGDLRAASMQRVNVGYAYSQLGALEDGERELRLALATAVRLGLRDVEGMARSNLALVLGHLGRAQEAEEEGMIALAGFQAQSNKTMITSTLLYIANARFYAGDPVGALSFAEQGFQNAANPSMRAASMGVLARIYLALGQTDQALENARQAIGILEIIRTIEDFDLIVWLGYVEALFAAGQFVEGEDALRTVRDLVQMRLASLGDESVRARAADGVSEIRWILALAERYLRDTENA